MSSQLTKYIFGAMVAGGLLASASVQAQPELYLTGKLGQTSASTDLNVNPVFWGYDNIEDDSSSYGLSFGINFSDYVGIELGYNDYGDYSENYTILYNGPNDYIGGTASGEVTAITLAVVGNIPLSDNFSLFGKLGLAQWDAKLKDRETDVFLGSVSTFEFSTSDSGSDVFYSLGAELDFTQNFGMFMEYQALSFEASEGSLDIDTELKTISVGAKFSF